MEREGIHEVLIPFTTWIQSLDFGRNITLKKVKSIFNHRQSYYILTNLGKGAKMSVPVQIFAKIQVLSASTIAFEIINTYSRKRFLFEYHKGDSFPFKSSDIDSISFESKVHNYQVFPYNYDGVAMVGSGFRENPNDENSAHIKTYSDHEHANGNYAPIVQDQNSKNTTNQKKNFDIGKVQNGDDRSFFELQTEVNILRQQNISASAQLLLYELSMESLSKEVNQLKNNTVINHQISIYDFVLGKYLAPTPNGALFSASNKTDSKKYTVKESLVNFGEPNYTLKEIHRSNELSLLNDLKASKTNAHANILKPVNISIEKTPLRTSYYIVSEPAIISLEEFFSNSKLKASLDINKKLRAVVLSQTLSGLSYLKDVHYRIHGGLNFNTLLIGADGFIKLSGFDHSFISNKSQKTLNLSSGSQIEDLLMKHVVLLQKLENNDDLISIKSTLDLWSLGCIIYRLMYGSHLFQGARNSREVLSVFESSVRSQVIEYLSELMVLEYDQTPDMDPSKLLIMTPNLQGSLNVSVSTLFT